MKLSGKTWLLATITAFLLVLNLVGEAAPEVRTLPSLPAFAPETVTKVTLSTPVEKLELDRVPGSGDTLDDAKWEIVTPLQFPADTAQIRSLLRSFSTGVNMEAYVDEGNLEDYAVDDQNGKLLEIFTDGPTPAVSVVIGKTAAGGTTFVRITGADKVYRADVGGRARFDHPAADWRDKMALDVDRSKVTGLVVQRAGETLSFERGPSVAKDKDGQPIPGPWTLANAPFPIDSELVESTVRSLTRMRAGEVHAADFEAGLATPAAVATLRMVDGSTHRVTLGSSTAGGASYVRVDDRAEVFQVSSQVRRQLTVPVSGMRDRSLFSFERKDLESMSLAAGGITVVLTQSADGATWSVTQPANMDADQRQALFTANTLATLRAFDVAPDDTFTPTGERFTLRFRDGHAETLDLGQAEADADRQPLVRVRVTGRPGVYRLKANSLDELRKAFGRG